MATVNIYPKRTYGEEHVLKKRFFARITGKKQADYLNRENAYMKSLLL